MPQRIILNKVFMFKRRRQVKLLLIIVSLIVCSFSIEANWKTERENLDHVFIKNEFRIFYTLNGKNQLPESNRFDLNLNGVPDYVENIAYRLIVAAQLYTDVFGFRHPLQSPRYKDKAKFIDVHILTLENKGSAGDSLIAFNYRFFPQFHQGSIAMKLSNRLDKDNMTSVHELFHLYQNGYTMFKNRWYTEGTARWAEYAFREGTGSRRKLPENSAALEEVMSQSYGAKYFWRRLAYLLDSNKGVFLTPPLEMDVIEGYPLVIEDERIYGYLFIKRFLENMDSEDNAASQKRDVKEYYWKEDDQKNNKDNNIYILDALRKTILQFETKENSEIQRFLVLLENYLENSVWK